MRLISFLFLLFCIAIAPIQAESRKFTCPMHPHYISDKEGTCPICGMTLVPIAENEIEMMPSEKTMEDNRPIITVPSETIQTMGVRTEQVKKTSFGQRVESVAIVKPNRRLQRDVSSRIAGWIENLRVKAVGDTVKKGDVLYELHSPELISGLKDYGDALKAGIRERIEATRRKLAFLGVSARALQNFSGKTNAGKIPFYAESSGIIDDISVREGSYVQPGQTIMRLQDYASVWIEADIAEQDLSFIASDATAKITFPNLGNKRYTAQIDYIYPTLDIKTRTGKVRLTIPNEQDVIRPGAFANVIFESRIQERLSVPNEAVLRDSRGEHVILSLGQGRFTARSVQTGISDNRRTEIKSGLQEDDILVVSGQFLIDSESALRESLMKMQPANDNSSSEIQSRQGSGHAGH